MTDRIKVGLVGIGNCFSGLIQGIEYYKKNPSQEVTGIIHDKLAGMEFMTLILFVDLMLLKIKLETL